jgi:hypothetical protein
VEPSFAAVPVLANSRDASASSTLLERQQFMEMVKQNLARAQNKMKHQADTKRSPRSFQVGEMVLLKL